MLDIKIKLTWKLKTLVFVLPISFFVLMGCIGPDPVHILLLWENDKATGLSISKGLVRGFTNEKEIEIQVVQPGERGPILGNLRDDGSQLVFRPIVPLTRGLEYEVFFKGNRIGSVTVPASVALPPELISIYPTQDTVPENLLKIYLQFSSPMVEGNSLSYLTLIRNSRDTLKGTFLDLSPELWNNDGTVLTLWLDPGRIKRDLIPNKTLGAPLEPYSDYSLHVSGKWKSKDGVAMESEYVKDFKTLPRDEQMPAADRWNMTIPGSRTSDALNVDLLESLDYSLLNDAIQILDSKRGPVKGKLNIGVEERSIAFFPDDPWKTGEYILQVETRLEDLAGNNLNRPFDRDLTTGKQPEDKKLIERKFVVR